MYKYFLGSRSNIATKRENEPIIIDTSRKAKERINKWLDLFEIDLDDLIEPVVSLIKSEVLKIVVNDAGEVIVTFVNNSSAVLKLYNEKEPKCEIDTEEIEYIIVLQDGYYVESFFEIIGDIRLGASISEKYVKMGKGNVYNAIKLDKYEEEIYEVIKKNIAKLDVWDNIAHNMIWIKELPVAIPSYELTISYIDERGYFITKIDVVHNLIFSFTQSNNSGEYEVESDGNWNAEHDIFSYRYNTWSKECTVAFPKGLIIPVKYYFKCFAYVKDYIKTMFQALYVINSTFEKVEKYKKQNE